MVRICDVTLRKRLTEFCETPLGKLTSHELETCALESFPPAQPPSFVKAREEEEKERLRISASPAEMAKQQQLAGLKARGGVPIVFHITSTQNRRSPSPSS